MKTTLRQIRKHKPCQDGWTKLLNHLKKTKEDDEPLEILTVLESNGLRDALWCLRTVEGEAGKIRLFAVWCARQVQHLLTDPRSIAALDVAEKFACGAATEAELEEARAEAAAAAVAAAYAAYAAASAYAYTTAAYTAAAYTDAADAAYGAAAAAAATAAYAAAAAAAGTTARKEQEAELIRICKEKNT